MVSKKMVDMNRKCPTGIPGLDELIEGGLPRKRSVLVSGKCGTGKTIFGIQFLYNGIVKYNEPGILVALEQDPKELRQDMKGLGFDLQEHERDGKLIIIDTGLSRMELDIEGKSKEKSDKFEIPEGSISLFPDELTMDKLLEIITEKADEINAKRIVIDSLPALDFLVRDRATDIKYVMRQMILAMNYRLKLIGLTSLLITEIPWSDGISPHGIESYVTDGVIVLSTVRKGNVRENTIEIIKMRDTKHERKIVPFAIDRGIRVFPHEEVFLD